MMGEHIHANWSGNRIYPEKSMYAGKTETGKETSRTEEQEAGKAPFIERQDRLEISSEAREADTDSPDSEERSGKVGFNGGKRARQLAAASTPEQVQMVIDLLNKDLDDCEAGLKQGMCDENEVAKVKAMLQKARQRMTEVSGQEPKEEGQGIDAFAMASLI